MSIPPYTTGRLPPQSLLRQRYLIVGLVGQGGMGAVYQALDTHAAQRRVAVKEMSQADLGEAERASAETRFQAEAALLGSLVHPGLPQVYEAFSEQGRLYLVMEFIEGKTLFQLLKENEGHPLPVSQVLAYADQLCRVLTYLHQQQPPIIFRDLKPANVMVTERGQVFLIDFGIARLFKIGQPQDTILLGSPGYASPEQHGISQTNPRSDLYSLGVILHQCLTARDPSVAANPFAFPSIRQYNLQVPEELEQLIQRLVAVSEYQRPGSALEVQQALQQISQQGGAPTERIPPMSPPSHYASLVPTVRAQNLPSPAVDSANQAAPPVAFAPALPSPIPVQHHLHLPAAPLWTPAFVALFVGLLVLTIGGSTFAFNFINGSDHLVEFSLALLAFLVLFGTALATRVFIAWVIFGLAGSGIVVAGAALLEQSLFLPTLVDFRLVPVFQANTLNQMITGGLAGAALVSLLWLTRSFSGGTRLVLFALFGLPLACIVLQYPADDSDVSKHILLLVGCITLIQGEVLAAQLERLRRRKSEGK